MHKAGAITHAIEGRAPPNQGETAMRKRDPKRVYVGIDISKDTLAVAWFGLDGELNQFEIANDEGGHQEIIGRITAGRIREARIVQEATGSYGDRLFAALVSVPKVRVMVIRPSAAKAFAKATNRRAKTDRVDAVVLATYAKSDTFKPTPVIDPALRQTRQLARHMGELIDRRAGVMNQRHAVKVGLDSSNFLLEALDAEEATLTTLIEKLEAEILRRLSAIPEARVALERLVELPGIKNRTAARLLPELLCMPKHLSPREAIAFAGLDPRPNQSGTSKAGTHWHISKQGNSRLRRVLYMAILSAVRWFKPLRAFYERLRARGKLPMVALTASMRKLLTAV